MKKICIFAGSSQGEASYFAQAAVQLAECMLERGYELVYGGASIGLMGIMADTYLEHGGHVEGVIPRFLEQREVAHHDISQLHIVDSMRVRKQMMIEMSDAFICMPGGLGSMEELFEVWCSLRLGLYKKPLALFNVDGFYDPLWDCVSQMQQAGFVDLAALELAVIERDPARLLEALSGRS